MVGTTLCRRNTTEADSPHLRVWDLTDWSVVEPDEFSDYRYNDKEIIRAFADKSAPTYEWLVAHGFELRSLRLTPDNQGVGSTGNSAPTEKNQRRRRGPGLRFRPVKRWPPYAEPLISAGIGLIKPLEVIGARKLGVALLGSTG